MVDYEPPRAATAGQRRDQDAVRTALERRPPWFTGALVKGVRMSSGANAEVRHRLGRRPNGFILVGVETVGAELPTEGFGIIAVGYGMQTAQMSLAYGGTPAIEVLATFWFW